MSDEEGELTLRVAKAIPSDVGHGRARVPFDNDLNLKPGDVIEIKGEKSTAAIVWRCRPEEHCRRVRPKQPGQGHEHGEPRPRHEDWLCVGWQDDAP